MSAQLSLWDPSAAPPPRRRWVPRCDDCGRRVWAHSSLRRRYGRMLGGGCHRKRRRAERRVVVRISVTDPGHIPGQGEIDLSQEPP